MEQGTEDSKKHRPIKILLADDDIDDSYFFEKTLGTISIPTQLVIVDNGEALMDYLIQNAADLPDVVFLDSNMPRKNGAESLVAIKRNPTLHHLPVILYSTSVFNDLANALYSNGAHYYFRKTDLTELRQILEKILTMMVENKFNRPSREMFLLNLARV